jgi:hypothetical protein
MLGATLAFPLGIWLLSLDAELIRSQKKMNIPIVVYLLGMVTVLFSLLITHFSIKKLLDKTPGLVFNEQGIIDNSSGVSAGLIPWEEIADIQIFKLNKVSSQRFLSIFVHQAESYVCRGNKFQQFLNRQNTRLSGTPINISTNSLKINFDELVNIVEEHVKYRRGHDA